MDDTEHNILNIQPHVNTNNLICSSSTSDEKKPGATPNDSSNHSTHNEATHLGKHGLEPIFSPMESHMQTVKKNETLSKEK